MMMHSTKLVMLLFTVAIMSSCPVTGQLNTHFYHKSCKNALTIIRTAIKGVVAEEKRMGASLVRMHFHDCFVNGCDGSILLDDNSTFTGEKSAAANANSVRGFEIIDAIKSQLEAVCPGVVSCTDILTLAATDSIIELGGPTWIPPLGRRDSTTASLNAANTNIPSPSSSLNTLISAFKAQGLSAKDMIALSGAHTIGQSKCAFFRRRIYNEQNINATFAKSLKANCPINGGDNNLANFDVTTPMTFDNAYYNNLKGSMGLLHSDQVLFNGGFAHKLVNTYAANQALFFSDFKAAMVKMANIKPLTGRKGQIRKNCRRVN